MVEWATDGDDGWHHLKTAVWDVVLLDWWLPGQDGLALLKKFRQTGSDTPVLMLTARDAVSDRVRGLDSGADDYLCKPFAFEELLERGSARWHAAPVRPPEPFCRTRAFRLISPPTAPNATARNSTSPPRRSRFWCSSCVTPMKC